ncbi:oligopeptide ABC transporter permease [Metamycoplasma cloacale]|uniref:ABC transporter permease n=1 Tax=Metamycoplasma cloacale TaxID=92401 RepID=A0A2Z4LLF8_9BACT|nr:ABC transporter permease [Metamycoplasma cloacale]AWX42599.1 ABC transporter permease [Metamycoplasma cloacale]VEU79666.1 oligopeptide ABC transporter permease [Metamycoplasma cloacale]
MKEKITKYLIKTLIFWMLYFVILTFIFFLINLLLSTTIKQNFTVYSQIDSNVFVRYSHYIKSLFSGSLGQIYSYNVSASKGILHLYFNYFKWTFLFTIITFTISILIGNLLGIYLGFHFNKTNDFIINGILGVFAAIPVIIISILALSTSIFVGYPSQFINQPLLDLISLIVPCTILSFFTISIFAAKARKTTKEVISSEYYNFAKSLGFNKSQLFSRVIFKQLLISELQLVIPIYLMLMTISIAIERIFSIPGSSVFLTFAFKNAELNLVLFIFGFNLSILMLSKFIIDIILNVINPEQAKEKNYFVFMFPRKKVKPWTTK